MNVIEFPIVPLTDIPGRLRLLADQIEGGEFENVQSVAIALEAEDTVLPLGFGASWDATRAVGLFFRAANNIINGDGDDE